MATAQSVSLTSPADDPVSAASVAAAAAAAAVQQQVNASNNADHDTIDRSTASTTTAINTDATGLNPTETAVNAVNAVTPTGPVSAADMSAAAAAASLVPPMVAAGTPPALAAYPLMFTPQGPPAAVLDAAAAAAAIPTLDDQPTFVNPKQYHRILKRREKRKKLTGSDVISYTPRKRSYMHESRHRHAIARKRGVGGRFLSKKKEKDQGKEESYKDGEENAQSLANGREDNGDGNVGESVADPAEQTDSAQNDTEENGVTDAVSDALGV